MHSGGLQRYWDENACYERMREGGHIARRVTKRLVAAAARAMDAFVDADWHTVRETVQELRGQGEVLAGLLAEHQSLLRPHLILSYLILSYLILSLSRRLSYLIFT